MKKDGIDAILNIGIFALKAAIIAVSAITVIGAIAALVPKGIIWP